MAGDIQPVAGGKLRRRATIFMTGAALSALYVWMQPAALGTLEANSAQAAEGSATGCVLNVAGTPLTVGGKEVRVQSSELCKGAKPTLAAIPAMPTPAAEPPTDLLRATIREEARPLAPVAERFSRAVPRSKPLRPPELIAADDRPIAEPVADHEDVERDHFRLAAREDRPDNPDDKPDNDRPEDGGEHSGGEGGEREEVCERDEGGEGYGGEGRERDNGRDHDGGEGGEGGESGGEGRSH